MAAIKIQTQQDYIPIHLADEEFRFYISDDSLLRIKNEYKQVQEEFKSIDEGDSEEENIEQMKKVLKKGFDFFFGEGSFEKIYAISPSTMICMQYFNQMADAIITEMEKKTKVTPHDKTRRYLNNKNKKK